MHNDSEEKTTSAFHGMIAMMRPKESWVANWNQMHAEPKDENVDENSKNV